MAIVLINETPTEVGSGADEIIRLREELAAAQDDVVAWKYEADGFRRNRDALSVELIAAQAKIDSLMLEYCPDEMTPEQIAEWGKWQRPINPDKQAAIDDAIAKEKTE